MATNHLLVKPLQDHLTGLLSKLDYIGNTKIKQALIDCTYFIMIEAGRINQGGGLL